MADLSPEDFTEDEEMQQRLSEFWDLSEEEQMKEMRSTARDVAEKVLEEAHLPTLVHYGLATWDQQGEFISVGGANDNGYWAGRLLADAVLRALQQESGNAEFADGLIDGLLQVQPLSVPIALAITERAEPHNGHADASPGQKGDHGESAE